MGNTLNNIYRHVSTTLTNLNQQMSQVQEQASTGSRINTISDAPTDTYRLLNLNAEQSSLGNFSSNVSEITETLQTTSKTLETMSTEASDVRTLITQVTGGIYSGSNRQTMAQGINQHLEQLVQLANSKHVNQYLFGGTSTGSSPYSVTRDSNSQISAVSYQGSDQQRSVQINTNINVNEFLVGKDTFTSDNRQDPEFVLSNTGATLGTGTSNVKGQIWLTATESNGTYYLSIDGGTTKTAVPADGSDNLAVTDADGNMLYVNVSDPSALKTGTDLIDVPGTYNLFDTMIQVRDLLNNTHNLSDSQLNTALTSASQWVSDVQQRVVTADSTVGSKISFLSDFKSHLDDLQNNAKDEASGVQDADVAQLAVNLNQLNALYQMSLSVAGKLLSISLLDYLK